MPVKRIFALMCIALLIAAGCSVLPESEKPDQTDLAALDPLGKTIEQRFAVPKGYERVSQGDASFGRYLRTLPLKPHGARVKYYDGRIKSRDVYDAVIDLDVGSRDLQQCADAVIRLRAEYLFEKERYEDIRFNFTSGFTADYSKWREGYRIKVTGNSVNWVKTAAYSPGYSDLRKYLDTVFTYAGTLSLAKELDPVQKEDMEIGDVFIQGGSPGHCVIVVDMAEHHKTGEKLFMLAQSYMPAQDIQVLKNLNDPQISPWYPLNFQNELKTPEWTFKEGDLKRFR